jgi:PPOX class probable F420-dependent enzyme
LVALSDTQLELLGTARRAVLATVKRDGGARLVPCAFAADNRMGVVVYSPLDDKPKSVADPRELGRVRDIRERPSVNLLVDHWDEDWNAIAWLRLDGRAALLEPGDDEHARAVDLLRARYPQYASHALEARPVIRIEVDNATYWSARG